MILVNCVWKQNKIIQLIENIECKSIKPFKFIRKEGMRIFFSSEIDDKEAVHTIKNIFHHSQYGNVLVFSVIPIINNDFFSGYFL